MNGIVCSDGVLDLYLTSYLPYLPSFLLRCYFDLYFPSNYGTTFMCSTVSSAANVAPELGPLRAFAPHVEPMCLWSADKCIDESVLSCFIMIIH